MNKRIQWLGPKSAPEGANIPFPEGEQRWHIYVDFACMPNSEFTLEEAYRYHGLDKAWDKRFTAESYYSGVLGEFEAMGLIRVVVPNE